VANDSPDRIFRVEVRKTGRGKRNRPDGTDLIADAPRAAGASGSVVHGTSPHGPRPTRRGTRLER